MKEGLVLDHASQFLPGDNVLITRYGEREDWAYPHQAGAKLVNTFKPDNIKPVPPMPEVVEAIFLGVENGVASVLIQSPEGYLHRGTCTWTVPVGFVKTAKWVAEWQPSLNVKE